MKAKRFKLPMLKLAFACIFFCCYGFKKEACTGIQNTNNTRANSNDSLKATKTITSFLQWYKINLHRANAFPLLSKDSGGYYQVNKKACIAYLDVLKSSQLVAPKYIGFWQTYFKDKAALLSNEKIQSDMPEGFNMDFVLITREPEIILNKINKLKYTIVSLNRNVALISGKLPSDITVQYVFEMYNSKEGWQIGYISTPNFD